MSAKVVETWHSTGKNVIINHIALRTVEHNLMKKKPLSSLKGQAEAFFLIDDYGNWWILKKFHNNCNLDLNYLLKVSKLLPSEEGFSCGKKRHILTRNAIQRITGCHYSQELEKWLDGTILMPRINGYDWAALADDLRDGSIRLDASERLNLCLQLTHLIELLENQSCAHRDISCCNVFVEPHSKQVSLIDFDSLFHPSLKMPSATTCGTTGYTCHLSWQNGKPDPKKSWCINSDRYALALLIAEFLLMDSRSKITGDGGLFDQEELKKQSGKGIDAILLSLNSKYSTTAQLLKEAIISSSFQNCPSPKDWMSFFNTIPGLITLPPALSDFPEFSTEYFESILNQQVKEAPIWQPPRLSDIPFG